VEWSLTGSDTNWRTENGDQRDGEWEPQILLEIFGYCPNITAKHKRVAKTKILKPTGDKST
jgi:hypothetical protein